MKTSVHIVSIFLLGLGLLLSACSESSYRWEIVFDEMPDASFRGIAAVDGSTCWVTGTGGTILRTTDGGATWQEHAIPGADSLDYRDIEAFGPDTAVTMSIGSGSQSRLYRTVDGGQNWTFVHQNEYEQGFYDAIAFWNNGKGVLQGDPIEGRLFIMVTEDSGKTWQQIPHQQMPDVEEGEYAFAASGTQLITQPGGHAWIATGGANARILHSRDYGQTWSSTSTPMIAGQPSTGNFSLAFANDSFGIAVGGDYTKEQQGTQNVIFTDNGGERWQLLESATLDFRSAIRYTEGTFITVGPSGSEYSTDQGQTWYPVEGPGFHTLSIGKGGLDAVWAAGRDGRIGKLVIE